MIDAVLSYHLHADTCGVAKWNARLARELGVPHLPLADTMAIHPLISIKLTELDAYAVDRLAARPAGSYDLLWHGPELGVISTRAATVWHAEALGCPSPLQGNPTRPGITVLSFGMAHKFQASYFACLKVLLDGQGSRYTVCVSTGIHEGHPWDVTTGENHALMADIFGDQLRWLGFLADDALAKELRDAHVVALFYAPAVRANNTTLWAALEAGTPIITNLDDRSPSELRHGISVFDLAQLTEWPDASECRVVRQGGRIAAQAYSWERVIQQFRESVHA